MQRINHLHINGLDEAERLREHNQKDEKPMTEKNEDTIINFLWRSNQIEGVHSSVGLTDAIGAWGCAVHDAVCPIDRQGILDIHRDLLQNLNPRIAGKFTTVQTMVGGRMNPDPHEVKRLLEGWCRTFGDMQKYVKSDAGVEASSQALASLIKEAHIAFEHIHPFEDGNGRVGRIIMNQQRLAVGLPVFTVWPDAICRSGLYWTKPEENSTQSDYYNWF